MVSLNSGGPRIGRVLTIVNAASGVAPNENGIAGVPTARSSPRRRLADVEAGARIDDRERLEHLLELRQHPVEIGLRHAAPDPPGLPRREREEHHDDHRLARAAGREPSGAPRLYANE